MKNLAILSLLALFINCERPQPAKNNPEKEKALFYAVDIFSVGKISLKAQEFKYGSVLKENETLVLEPKSICDLQLSKEESVIRIRGKNQFRLERIFLENNTISTKISLEQGNALIRVDKKLSQKESLEIVTPTLALGVQGTQFRVEVGANQTTKVSVYEGTVAVKLNVTKIEDKNIQENLDQKEIIVSGGNALQLNQQIIENLAKQQTPEKIEQNLKEIQSKFIKPISEKEIREAKNELNELTPISADSFKDEAKLKESLASRIDSLETDLLNRMGEADTKKKGFIVLKNDQKILGYIKQETGTYFVETPKGILSFPESEVMEVSY